MIKLMFVSCALVLLIGCTPAPLVESDFIKAKQFCEKYGGFKYIYMTINSKTLVLCANDNSKRLSTLKLKSEVIK